MIDVGRRPATLDDLQDFRNAIILCSLPLELLARELRSVRQLDHARLGRAPDQERFELAFVLDEHLAAAALGAEQRRLRDVDVPALDSSRMWRKKNVSSSVRMCEPSTSASVMMMILP